jgi:hypothetical protein
MIVEETSTEDGRHIQQNFINFSQQRSTSKNGHIYRNSLTRSSTYRCESAQEEKSLSLR